MPLGVLEDGRCGFSKGIFRIAQLKSLGVGAGKCHFSVEWNPRVPFLPHFQGSKFCTKHDFNRGHFDVRDITVKLSRQLRESQF